MKWQISRHGYKVDPRSSWQPLSDWEHPLDAHEVDYCDLSVFAVLDYLILLAEEDYLELK